MHGGAVMTLADSLGAVCAFLNLPPGASTSTITSSTNFFRAVRDGEVVGTTRPLHVGRTTIVVQTELRDANDKLVALVTQTQAVLTPTAGATARRAASGASRPATARYASSMISATSVQSGLRSRRTPIQPAVPDVRGHEEPVGLLVDQLGLHAGRRRAPQRRGSPSP